MNQNSKKLPEWYIDFVKDKEGKGWHHTDGDPGGPTHTGVTLDTFVKLSRQLAAVDNNFKVYDTMAQWLEAHKNLSDAQFRIILSTFYMTASFNGMLTGRDAIYATELMWGSGYDGYRVFQKAIASKSSGFTGIDGIPGPATSKAANALGEPDSKGELALIDAIYGEHVKYINSLGMPKFTQGWQNRAKELYEKLKNTTFYEGIIGESRPFGTIRETIFLGSMVFLFIIAVFYFKIHFRK